MLVIQLGVVDGCRGSKSLVELTMPVSALIGGYFKEKNRISAFYKGVSLTQLNAAEADETCS